MDKIAPEHRNEHGSYEYYKHAVTDSRDKYEAAYNQTVAAFYTLPPGKSSCPFHYHTANEEVFYIISGSGIFETPDTKYKIKAGDILVCPAGKNGAHKIINPSETENLVYLDVDTNNTPDIVYYPHSNKIGIRAAGGIHDNYGADNKLNYYDGE